MNQQITRKVLQFLTLNAPVLFHFPGITLVFYLLTLQYKCKTFPTADFIRKETEKEVDLSRNYVLQKLFHNMFTALAK